MPNFPVDVNSWGKSACYPRSTFCPLSDGPSTQHHQIIKTCFRTCPRCRARSQAPFCLYTSYPDFRPGQGDLRAPPLLFGRRPPQSNRLPNIVPIPASRKRLEILFIKAGISPLTPRNLTATPHSLPAILHMINRIPILSYGEGSRGLSV